MEAPGYRLVVFGYSRYVLYYFGRTSRNNGCLMTTQQPNSTATRPYRRDVMKALGAGTAVGMLGGVAVADEHEDETEDEPTDDPDDSYDDEALEQTVHVVRTLIRESTNPERPADFFYQPTGLHIEPGDVIKFVFETPDHTVTSYHPAFGMQRRVPSGVQPFSSPILGWDLHSLPDDIDMPPGEEAGPTDENDATADQEGGPRPTSWLYPFETPGVYDLECAPHEAFGMVMRVVVGEETETAFETSNPEELPPPRAGPVELARQVLTDPNLEPDSIVEDGRVEWMDIEVNQEPENGADDGTENGTGADDESE